MPEYVHVVWAEVTGPIRAYPSSMLAHAHAGTMVGVQMATCEVHDRVGTWMYIVWSKSLGPVRAFWNSMVAHRHAASMRDVIVSACELANELPDHVVTDLVSTEFDEEATPEVQMQDIDDVPPEDR